MKCLYDKWCDAEATNINNFTISLFKLFQIADGNNKAIIISSWPTLFENSTNI